jgi:hypothetical protein
MLDRVGLVAQRLLHLACGLLSYNFQRFVFALASLQPGENIIMDIAGKTSITRVGVGFEQRGTALAI